MVDGQWNFHRATGEASHPVMPGHRAAIAQPESKGMDSHAPSVSARPKLGIANGNEKFEMLGEHP